jgi:hypothetical protein
VLQRLALGRWFPVGRPGLTDSRGAYTRVVNAVKGTRFRLVWQPTKTSSRPIVIR